MTPAKNLSPTDAADVAGIDVDIGERIELGIDVDMGERIETSLASIEIDMNDGVDVSTPPPVSPLFEDEEDDLDDIARSPARERLRR